MWPVAPKIWMCSIVSICTFVCVISAIAIALAVAVTKRKVYAGEEENIPPTPSASQDSQAQEDRSS